MPPSLAIAIDMFRHVKAQYKIRTEEISNNWFLEKNLYQEEILKPFKNFVRKFLSKPE